jgi:hypothetical protein
MTNEMAQAFLSKVLEKGDFFDEQRKYFQNMARYKYDDYQQYAPGMRFIERFALWLKQILDETDRASIATFIRDRLVFISNEEMNLLVSSCFPDLIKKLLVKSVAIELHLEDYMLESITSSSNYRSLIRQSLFFGLSDGARTDIFRRANSGIISHEQVYLTYELSKTRAGKMQKDLEKDLSKMLNRDLEDSEKKFKRLFLLDDFSASGTSYLKLDGMVLKGKISQLYESIFEESSDLSVAFDKDSLEVHIILYLCTEQAERQIKDLFKHLERKYKNTPQLHCMHLIPEAFKLTSPQDQSMIELCLKDTYYDPEIEDEHTGPNIHLGFKNCALPLILSHNCPNNSVSILWSYEHLTKFKGLFPRIPRHRTL